jgi:hypothetical protein
MGRKARLRLQRKNSSPSQTHAERIWAEKGPHWASGPYYLFATYWANDPGLRAAYARKVLENPEGLVFFEMENPDRSAPAEMTLIPFAEIPKFAKACRVNPSWVAKLLGDWEYRVWDPKDLASRNNVPPTAIAVWHTGGADSDFVSEARAVFDYGTIAA